MVRVEFRFLQLIVSHVSGDRVTLGLLHWDGDELRVASSFAHLSFCAPSSRETVRRTVNAKLRQATQLGREAKGKGFMFGLTELVPVREGLGASLGWSEVQSSLTRDPAAHFEQLKAELRLTHDERVEAPISNLDLQRLLRAEAKHLRAEAPDRVRVANEVRYRQAFRAPVSWKNGKWHHALPFSLDGLDEAAMEKRVRELVGLVELCIPPGDVPVPVAVLPLEAPLADVARREADMAITCLAAHTPSLIVVEPSAGGISLEPVVARIRADIM